MFSQASSIAPRSGKAKMVRFEVVFCFIYESVSCLADQVSILAAKYGSIVVDVSIAATTCLLRIKFSFSS